MPVFVEDTTYVFTGEYETEYTFNVVAVPADEEKFAVSEAAVVTATTEAEDGPAPGSELSVADFLELKDTANEYVLTGKITNVANTSYGNFDLTDETGSVYVYGLLTPEGASQKQWAAAGLRVGDTITIKGKYSVYNGSPQIKNATYVSHVAAPFIEATAVSVEAAETAATLAVSSNVAWTVACDAEWVTSYTTSGENDGAIAVEMEANESEEDRVASFTLSAEGVEAVVVKLTQKGVPAEGEVVGGSDDFDTKSVNTSYTTGKTNAGWNYTNCAILDKSTVTAITDSSKALTMNGKTSAKGTITSPVFATGCGTLTFNYAHAYKESKGFDFNVEIIQNGEVVKTYNVKVTSTTQNMLYEFSEDVNVSGEFQVKFSNNSPSNNSSSNKDRYSIWDIEWTGCN
jgi:DNA/RNA endonuclease YhcR with UshA esterase domain